MRDFMETMAGCGFRVIGVDEEGMFEMKPAEMLFGPTGLVCLESLDENTVLVTCRNGLTKKECSFTTTNEVAAKLSQWRVLGGNIQDVIPELDIDKREMCISGMTPEDWKETFSDDE